jgi:hypothetical protein
MAFQLESGFVIAKFSDLDYEGMTVEVRYNGVPVAQLNRDKGKYAQEIEIPARFSPEEARFIFPVNAFIKALEEARRLLETLE